MTRSGSYALPRFRAAAAVLAAGALATALLATAGQAHAAASTYTASYLPLTAHASAIAADPDTGTVYAGMTNSDLAVVDDATGAVTTTISLASIPEGIAVDTANDTIWVSERSLVVQVINAATDAVSATIAEPGEPRGIAVDDATGTVYVSQYNLAAVSVINATTDEITGSIATGPGTTPSGIAVDEATDDIWVGGESGGLVEISGTSDAVLATLSLAGGADMIAVNPATDVVYASEYEAGSVAVIDGATATLTTAIATGTEQLGIAVDPATDTIFATSAQTTTANIGTTWVIDTTTDAITDTIPRGGFYVAIDQSTGIAYTEVTMAEAGLWAIAPSAVNEAAPVITTDAEAAFLTNYDENFTVTATAEPAASFTETGALPPGVTFSSDGTLSGTPEPGSAGTYSLVVTPGNAAGLGPSQDLTIDVTPGILITSAAGATAQVGVPFTVPLTAVGDGPVTFSEHFDLPGGVILSQNGSGQWQLSGTPTPADAGPEVFLLTAASSDASQNQSFTLTVNAPPQFTSAPKTIFLAGYRGVYQLSADAYPATVAFDATSQLPGWLHLSDSGDLTASVPAKAGGLYHLAFAASNGIGAGAVQQFTLIVYQRSVITSASHATFRAGRHATFTFRATGFPLPKLAERGRLPGGLRFRWLRNGTAVLTGIPSRADIGRTFTLIIVASNKVPFQAIQRFRLTIS